MCRTAWRFLVAALAITSPAALAQTTPSPPDTAIDWRSANDAAGQFRRGHADVLKWEQANLPETPETPETPEAPKLSGSSASLALMAPENAVRLAWQAHLDLATPLAVLGQEIAERIASGRWMEIDPVWQRRVEGMDEVLDVAAAARKDWLQAVAARQALTYQREALVAAEAASELAKRMASVGNWSQLQQARVQIALKTARMELKRAEYAYATAQADLLERLQLTGMHSMARLPDTLPELPAGALSDVAVQQRLANTLNTLPRAEGLRTKAHAALAFEAYRASHEMAARNQEILKLQEFITDETVLHYNGMLKSVWDVLGEASNRSQAAIDAVATLRDFWIAEIDLQHVLLGGSPERFVSLGGSSKEAAAAH